MPREPDDDSVARMDEVANQFNGLGIPGVAPYLG
jgi:hypothetical protein